jgi:hypothetical protein
VKPTITEAPIMRVNRMVRMAGNMFIRRLSLGWTESVAAVSFSPILPRDVVREAVDWRDNITNKHTRKSVGHDGI